MRKWVSAIGMLCLGAWLSGADFSAAEQIVLSSRLSPEVKAAVRLEGDVYRIRVEAENPYAAIAGRLGLSGAKSVILPIAKFPGEFSVKKDDLGAGTLRMALEVSWFNADKSLRQREVFRAQAPGNLLPADTRLWEAFDYNEYRNQVVDRERQIRIPVTQPVDGKLTVVVEDKDGKRIKNLVSGIDYAAGKHSIVWDGRDELGNLIAPGDYRFRTLSHPGVMPRFQMMFANGDEKTFIPWGPNHGTLTAFAVNSKYVFTGAPLTEGGWALIALNQAGKVAQSYHEVGGSGIEEVFLAADEKFLYVLNDGGAWGRTQKQPTITLTVFEIESGKVVSPKGSRAQYTSLFTGEQKNDKTLARTPFMQRHFALRGAVLCAGALYVGNADEANLMKVDTETHQVVDRIPVPVPKVLATDGKKLFVVSEKKVLEVDPATKGVKELFTLPFEARGVFFKNDLLYLTGSPDDTVKVYSLKGKLQKTYGEPGGAYAGKWRPERLVTPIGIAVATDDGMWVAEYRTNPKRISKWDLKSGKVVYDKVGSPAYGSPAAGFNPRKPCQWFGFRVSWDIDVDKKTAKIASVLQKAGAHLNGKYGESFNYKFVERDGRTFVLGLGKATLVCELMPDGSLRDLALISDGHNFLYGLQWNRIAAFSDTFEKAFPKAVLKQRYADPSCRSVYVLWVDKNGNGDLDADEFEFAPAGSRGISFGWGLRLNSLDILLGYRTPEGVEKMITLSPDGYNKFGAPNYSLAKAIEGGKNVAELPRGSRSMLETSLNDTRGNLVVNASPYMLSLDKNGKLNWIYPNRWTNVHGSHDAPLPRPGEFQGLLFSLGCAPLDKEGDVMVWIGNHGRLFLMTTDGMYVDEMFPDCRVAEVVGAGLVGGEPFGGNFEYDAVNKRYVLSAGTSGYRIYHLTGLDQVKRAAGTLKVTPQMVESAARQAAAAEQTTQVKLAHFTRRPDKTRGDWAKVAPTADWASERWSIQVKAQFDSENLYLRYQVTDTSPWVNFGKDWTRLFKTGDTIDFQIGTDASARADRKAAVEGDIRLSIAPFEGKPIAVLYRYRVKDKAGLNTVEFASPWRSETVDDVRRIDSAKINLQKSEEFYVIDATVPLAELGLKLPAGKTFRGDFGVVYGDREGTMNLSRFYWSNKATGLVNDVPGETMLTPQNWGEIKFAE